MRIRRTGTDAQVALADFVGLDTLFEIGKVLYKTTGDSEFRPAPLLVKYAEADWIGRKVDRGFYDSTGGKLVQRADSGRITCEQVQARISEDSKEYVKSAEAVAPCRGTRRLR